MAELVATLKAGKDFNAPWLVLHADSPTELSSLLDYTSGDLLAKINTVAQQFQGFANAAPLAPQPGVTQQPSNVTPTSQAPSAQQAAPAPAQQSGGGGQQHPEGTACDKCGQVLEWKSGTSKAGKPYKGWFCPSPERGHKVIWG